MYSRFKQQSFGTILVLIIISLVFVFSVFIIKEKNKVINVELNDKKNNLISIKSKLTMDDDTGKSIVYDVDKKDFQGYLEFEVKSNSTQKTNFEIYAVEGENLDIHPNYIKVYLTDENDKPIVGYDDLAVPTFYNLRVSSFNPGGRRIYYGSIKPDEVKKYRLRVWFSDAYTLESEEKEFNLQLNVEAEE